MLKKSSLMCLVLLVLAGCSLPARPPVLPVDEPKAGADELWRITIKQGGEQKFSGLLGTRFENDGLSYVLLDGTGITMLEARLTATGERRTSRELGVLEGHRLPAFLGTSLYRIFLLEPEDRPCGRNFLMRLCRRKTERGEEKFARAGLLPLWSVDYLAPGKGVKRPGITFTNFWLGVTLELVKQP